MMRGSQARSSLPQGWSQTVESRINIGLDKERDHHALQITDHAATAAARHIFDAAPKTGAIAALVVRPLALLPRMAALPRLMQATYMPLIMHGERREVFFRDLIWGTYGMGAIV